MSRIRAVLHEYRPSVVTGGAPATPLLVLAAFNGLDELDRSAFGVLVPEIRDYFGVSLTTILTVTALAALLPIFFALPIGYYADRWPRKRIVAAGACLWGMFSILTGFSTSLLLLGIFRIGAGVGRTTEPASLSLVADYYAPDRRTGAYSVFRMGNELGLLIAPVTAGFLASVFFWQAPFLLFGVPSVALALFTLLKLREPVRGAQERLALGVADDEAMPDPPSWTESWRVARGVRTLRRIWISLPFLVGAGVGILSLLSVYYDEVFDLSVAARGTLGSFDRLFAIVGVLVGGALGNRFLTARPARVVFYSALVALIPAAAFAVIAISPWLALSVGAGWTASFALPILGPTLNALMSVTIPARVRGFALAGGALFVAPGLLILPLAGGIADHFGARAGILMLVPVFLIGAAILGSAGASVEADIRAATAAAAAAAEVRRAREAGRAKLLVCRDVDVHYGQVQILFGVDFDVEQGEIVALLGTNGAGKSTLLNAIAGVVTASNGSITFEGEDITFLPSSEHVTEGIVMVPGGKGVFPSLTVEENLQLAEWALRDPADELRAARERVFELFPRLRERASESAGSLSGGEQQMLALGQAFIARPRLLIIDELSLGLAPAIVEQLLDIIRTIRDAGTTVVLVEQSVNVALTIADRAVFMEKGEVRFSGPTRELMQRSDILRSVFLAGSGVGSGARKKRERADWEEEPEVVLELRGVTRSFGGVRALDGVDLVLRQGEILGLIGPNGAGKTTLFDAISGFVVPDEGTVTFVGDDVTDRTPDERARVGLVRSFQDARLFPSLTVDENILVALDQHLTVRNPALGAMRLPNVTKAEARLRKRTDRLVTLLNLAAFRDKRVRDLSTGTRRLVDLACVLAADPTVLLLDEPSSGIAQRETEELGPLIQRIKTETACSILIIEHDMPLISTISDELIAMELGAVVTRGVPDAVLSHPRVIEAYLGTSEEVIKRSGQLT
jgi:branched-chain amino acid transport system ATP-binding protein